MERVPQHRTRPERLISPSLAPSDWLIETRTASAADHHHAAFPASSEFPSIAHVWDLRLRRPALVLGGRQELSASASARAESDGVEVTPRRSGGGAVWIAPDTSVWIDLLVPVTHPWFHDDLTVTFRRTGELWQSALESCGVTSTIYSERPDPHDELAKAACFAGLGWGEVVASGQKVVGLSQRRTRDGARVQCLADLSGQHARVADYLDLSDVDAELIQERCGVPVRSHQTAAVEVREAFLRAFLG